MKTILLILTTFILLLWGIVWNTGNIIVEPGQGRVASERIKRTMHWFGYNRNYRIISNGELQVEINNKWLRLKYKDERSKDDETN